MYTVCKIKNIDSVAAVYCGQQMQPNDVYQIQDFERVRFGDDSNVLISISTSKLQVGNGTIWYMSISDQFNHLKMVEPRDIHGKISSHETTRPPDCTTCWVGRGDDTTDPTKVRGGERMIFLHKIGESPTVSKYIDLNIKENKTYVHEGYLFWKGCVFDTFTARVVPQVTASSAGENTYFNLYGGYLIVPAAGDGTLVVNSQDIKLVEMPIDQNSGLRAPGFWNADYSTMIHQFSNITPAPNGDGLYNMFAVEVSLNDFFGEIAMLGTNNTQWFQAADAHEIGHGMRIKFIFETFVDADNPDHEWRVTATVVLHRNRTC